MNSLQVQVIVPAFMSKFIQFEFCFFFFLLELLNDIIDFGSWARLSVTTV